MTGVGRLLAAGILAEDVPLGPMTTYKAGGPASLFAEVRDRGQLEALIASGVTRDHPVLVLGRGSNLVVADSGFPGLVIKLTGEFSTTTIDREVVDSGAAMPLPRLARLSVEAGLTGLEFFVGVPGSVGGAVRQNAGCFGTETKDRLISATIIDLATAETVSRDAVELDLTYRHSNVAATDLVISAAFQGSPGDPERGKELMREITRWRKENQPGGTLNAGSVFKNPAGTTAGELSTNWA
jgi:UDP-N-acetylmuramate dehydrogenase